MVWEGENCIQQLNVPYDMGAVPAAAYMLHHNIKQAAGRQMISHRRVSERNTHTYIVYHYS